MTATRRQEATARPRFAGVTLRPYQTEALEAIEKAESAGMNRQLIQMATGLGKTVLFSELIRRRGGRALVLVHRDELITQALEKLHAVAPELEVGVVKAKSDEVCAEVVVASIQTLARRKRRERIVPDFTTIVVDEAHHSAAPSYVEVLRYFGALS